MLREKISGTVTALLGLVGLNDIDPVRSREHILLSNIFENAWSQGQDLDLGELILQTQTPPFHKLGVFDVNTFFPEKDRFELAMLLNNILAAPAFQTWIEGQPLDIPSLLYTPDGRPRHSIFYIAHLTDAERMFFVTLLFSAVETWMRTQTGTTSLARAPLLRRDLRLPAADRQPALQAADAAHAQAGARLRRGAGAGHPEPGRSGLQGPVQRRHLVHRQAADRPGQAAPAGRPGEAPIAARRAGPQRLRPADLRPGQARFPDAQRACQGTGRCSRPAGR